MGERENPDFQSVLQALLAKPELIEALKHEVLGKIEDQAEEPQEKPALPERRETEERDIQGSAALERKREKLLCALKPYLSPRRAQAVDTAMNLARILDSVRMK